MSDGTRQNIDRMVGDAKRLLLGKGLDATTYATVENTLRDLGDFAAGQARENLQLRQALTEHGGEAAVRQALRTSAANPAH